MFKFLVLNPSSKADEIVNKANLQQAKNGPFELILLVNPLEAPGLKVPAYTYGSSTIDNVNGVTGIVKLTCGVTLALIDEESDIDYNESVDIIMLKHWPSKLKNQVDSEISLDFRLDNLVKKLKPRYVFSTGKFHEYGPFQWDNGTVCRFISLAVEGEGKWFYAFNFPLIPAEVNPRDLAENPFIDKKRKTEEDTGERKRKTVTPQDCFFCLSNPKVETHMIVDIGEKAYITVAKGPLTRSNPSMPFSGHGILIPVEHQPTNTQDVDGEMKAMELKIYQKFKQTYPDLTLITFDINLKKNVHYHRQFMPINRKYSVNFSQVLDEKSEINNEKYKNNHKLKFETTDKLDLEKEYVCFKVYDNEEPTIYVNYFPDSTKSVDLQFPRRVLSYLIKSPKRLYWDRCQQPRFKEQQDCQEFKKFLG